MGHMGQAAPARSKLTLRKSGAKGKNKLAPLVRGDGVAVSPFLERSCPNAVWAQESPAPTGAELWLHTIHPLQQSVSQTFTLRGFLFTVPIALVIQHHLFTFRGYQKPVATWRGVI